ncbi:MAG: magnesium/cobalt transporter CorA [Phycisphaerales bacterium]|nr:magnesium/cobalt transporter CorA [Phycisphaerales bacterium]
MLVTCTVYQEGRKLRDISIVEISDYVCRSDCLVWVALKDAEHAELEEMRLEFGLHELAIEDAHHGHQRPKIEEYDESLFTVMKPVEMVNGELSVGEMAVFVGKNYVLSVRNHSEQNFRSVRERCEREPHLLQQGAGFVLYALMDTVVDRYFPLVEALESELETIEDEIFVKGSARSNIERLYELKGKVTVLKHVVAPLLEAVAKLHGGWVPQVCDNTQEYFRDVHDHLARINASIDAIRDAISVAIQVNLSMVTIDQSEVSKRLAAWAGIFAMATTLAGIWGMNFEVMPELKWVYGYPVALLAIAIICGILYIRFKRAEWL